MTRREQWGLWWRSWWVDAAWNFQRHQNVGFLFMMTPALKRRWKDRDALAAAMKRYTRYVSTHPAMIPVLGGLSLREEEALRADSSRSPKDLHRLKGLMMGPLAAMGDGLFWSTLKPLTLLLGVASVVTIPQTWGKYAALIGLLAAYNFFRLWLMWKGFTWGYERGVSAVGVFQGVTGSIQRFQAVGIVVVASLTALLYPWSSVTILGRQVAPSFAVLAIVLLFMGGLRGRISSTVLFYVVTVGCVLAAYGWDLRNAVRVEVPW